MNSIRLGAFFSFVLWMVFSGAVAAQNLDACETADATKAEDVFACLSVKFAGRGTPRGECRGLQGQYFKARREAVYNKGIRENGKIPDNFAMMHQTEPQPSCAIIADAVELFEGEAPYWKDCIGADGTNPTEMKKCLLAFVPGYYGGKKTIAELTSCTDITQAFQRAYQASTGRDAQMRIKVAPTANCKAIAAVFTPQEAASPEWAKCFNYDPQNVEAHVRKCVDFSALEAAALRGTQFLDCAGVRREYENGLENAYGSMPPNYRGMPCGPITDLIAEYNEKIDGIRRARAEAARKQREAQALAKAEQAKRGIIYSESGGSISNLGSIFGLSGFMTNSGPNPFTNPIGWGASLLNFNPARMWAGFWVQFLFTVAAWVYAWRQQSLGKWWVPKGVIFERVAYARIKLVNVSFFLILIFFLGYGLWFGVGALIAAIITRVAEPIIADLGFFKTQSVESGIVEDTKSKDTHSTEAKGPEIQSKQDW